MRLTLRDNLLFATVTVEHGGIVKDITNVLIDTGSVSTVISADAAADLGILPLPSDVLRRLRGIGGHEYVFNRDVDRFQMGERSIEQFAIESSGMDYGFDINGILGMSFLREAGAVLNLRDLALDYV